MSRKLHTFCCRLCLHDGSVEQLIDILSVANLASKIEEIFNIYVTSNDTCTKNICLSCFQNTLNLQKQYTVFRSEKRKILAIQHTFEGGTQNDDSAATENEQTQVLPERADPPNGNCSTGEIPVASIQQRQVGPQSPIRNSNEESIGSKDPLASPRASVRKSVPATTTIHNSSTSMSNRNKTAVMAKPNQQLTKDPTPIATINQGPGEAENHNYPIIDLVRDDEEAEQSGDSNGTNIESNQRAPSTNTARDRPQIASHVVQSTAPLKMKIRINPQNVAPRGDVTNSKRDAQNAPASESSRTANVSQTKPPVVANPSRELINGETGTPAAFKASNVASTLNVQQTASDGKKKTVSYVIRKVVPVRTQDNKTISVSIASKTAVPERPGLVARPSTSGGQIIYNADKQNDVAEVNCDALASVSASASAQNDADPLALPTEAPIGQNVDRMLPETITSSDILGRNPGLIKKRRHSTYIRVSSNLFDEPPEKAQFAMLNNCLAMHNPNIQQDLFSHLPSTSSSSQHAVTEVVPQRLDYQITSLHQNSAAIPGTLNNSAQRPPGWLASAGGSNNIHVQTSIQHRLMGNQAGVRQMAPIIRTGTVRQPVSTLATGITASTSSSSWVQHSTSGVPVNSARPPQHGGPSNARPADNFGISNNETPGLESNTSIRPCYKCNYCNYYYLLVNNVLLHLQRVHNVEVPENGYIEVYDQQILNKLLIRSRRKSVADPEALRRNVAPGFP